jgi:hypothetical protein
MNSCAKLILLALLLAGEVAAGLGASLQQQKDEYGEPQVDRQRRSAYPGLLFRHFSLNGSDIDVGVQKVKGVWRSVWESYQNSRETRSGYQKGRPVFTRKILPITPTDISRRLSSSAGGITWPSEGKAETSASGDSYVILKRLDGRAYAILNDQIIYLTFARYYPILRQQLQLPEPRG